MAKGWVTPLLTAEQVAERLQAVSVNTIHNLRRKGMLKGFRVGRTYRFDERDITEYINNQRENQ